jgi:hypothetical protein
MKHILQIAYLTESEFSKVCIDGQERDVPQEVRNHFRNVKNISRMETREGMTVRVFDQQFDAVNRLGYLCPCHASDNLPPFLPTACHRARF